MDQFPKFKLKCIINFSVNNLHKNYNVPFFLFHFIILINFTIPNNIFVLFHVYRKNIITMYFMHFSSMYFKHGPRTYFHTKIWPSTCQRLPITISGNCRRNYIYLFIKIIRRAQQTQLLCCVLFYSTGYFARTSQSHVFNGEFQLFKTRQPIFSTIFSQATLCHCVCNKMIFPLI